MFSVCLTRHFVQLRNEPWGYQMAHLPCGTAVLVIDRKNRMYVHVASSYGIGYVHRDALVEL